MKMHHIDDFKCILCTNWFCPPYNLPYMLPCTHSVCTNCLQKVSVSKDHTIICPQDLEGCQINEISLNTSTKKALERLMKEHKNYNQNSQLECIKALSISFDEILATKQKNLKNLEVLIDQIFSNEIERLKNLNQKLKAEINRPFRIVEDWKQVVTLYLTGLKQTHKAKQINSTQLFHYIEQGRKIKMDLTECFNFNFDIIANNIAKTPTKCFHNNFQIFDEELKNQKVSLNIEEKINAIQRDSKSSKGMVKNQEKQLNQKQNIICTLYDEINEKQKSVKKVHRTQNYQQHQIPENNGRNSLRENSLDNLKDLSNLPIEFAQDNKEKTMKISSSARKRNSIFQQLLAGDDDSASRGSLNSVSKNNRSIDKQLSLSQFQLYSQNDLSGYCREYQGRQTLKNKRQFAKNNKAEAQYPERPKRVKDKGLKEKGDNGFLGQERGYNPYSHQNSQNNSRNNSIMLLSPGVIKQQYTEEGQQNGQNYDNEQLLLDNDKAQINQQFQVKKNKKSQGKNQNNPHEWVVGNYNFMKEWQIHKQKPEEEMEIRKRGYYNCEREKSVYTRKMQVLRAQEAYKFTLNQDNYIQVINESLHDVDMNLYLNMFDWSDIEVIKFVRTSMTDDQLNVLLNFIVNSKVKALVLSGNSLTDISLDAFLYFVEINESVKNVYLPKNYINILKSKAKINLLRDKGINIYV